MRTAWIISSGTELTVGRSVDTNAAWLAEKLGELGITTRRIVTVPDDAEALREVVCQAAGACDVVVITGGLGPTDDDLTRVGLARAAGVPLEIDGTSLDHLRAFFAERGREMPEANRVQALLPHTGRALPNTCGTAPGIALAVQGTPCFALPGVPFEMQAMFLREVAPVLAAAARGRVCVTRLVRTFGRPESAVGELLRDLMARGRNPDVGTTASLGVISVRISAQADSHAEAQQLLDEDEDQIRRRLGSAVFGREDDTLASAAGDLLVQRGATLSTAESCTGGLVGALLTEVPGSSRYYLGGAVTYANQAKERLLGVPHDLLEQYGAVSRPVARAMAAGVRHALGSTHAISVTGVAGPTGGSVDKPVGLVYVGIATPGREWTAELRWGADTPRQVIRLRSATSALDLLRRELLGAAVST